MNTFFDEFQILLADENDFGTQLGIEIPISLTRRLMSHEGYFIK